MFFNPSCGLCLYKPKLTERVYEKLHAIDPSLKPHGICCRRNPELPQGAVIINVCPSCDNHWRTRYEASAPYLCMNILIAWTPLFCRAMTS